MLYRILRAVLVGPPSDPSPAGGMPFDSLYPSIPGAGIRRPTYRPPWSIAAATESVLLAPWNPVRRRLTIVNDSTADLYVAKGSVATTVTYAAKVSAGGLYVMDEPYQGDVAGVWSAANGAARVTEET